MGGPCSWCGIFALWAYLSANAAQLRWTPGGSIASCGFTEIPVPISGCAVVARTDNFHHAIVKNFSRVNNTTVKLQTVEGNIVAGRIVGGEVGAKKWNVSFAGGVCKSHQFFIAPTTLTGFMAALTGISVE
jgi:hypothetical protein